MDAKTQDAIRIALNSFRNAFRRKLPIKADVTTPPFVIFHTLDSDGMLFTPQHSIKVSLSSDRDKFMVKQVQEQALANNLCDMTFFVSEAWAAQVSKDEKIDRTQRVSERADSREVLMINVSMRDGRAMVCWPIGRDAEGRFVKLEDADIIFPDHAEGALVPKVKANHGL